VVWSVSSILLSVWNPFHTDSAYGYTVSGGFATVHPSNSLTINAVEAYPLDSFSPEVKSPSYVLLTQPTHHRTH
jgi:F0F1-type ATP synthase epsilon subunit